MTRTDAAVFLLELFAITPSYSACTAYETVETALLSAPQHPVFIGRNLTLKSFNHLQTVLKNESSDKLLL
ncbi:hypothetical protein ALP29_200921 [Pseudomonas syringae pv. avii]|uniref:Uncharacterized protein n=1 Tax=Pseudomonas syringae pv. avii TaxID=663959 RepID=A0A3M5VJA6_PSESX|nr:MULTISPECIES: hypothetical protein [Pseudomonas syringae group]RMU58246.1 hypothetical protein ALP29_200921 [Pseudomonas syringae pv. avii]